MKRFLSFFTPRTPWLLTYMLQQSEYDPFKFAAWVALYPDLSSVQKRGKLKTTRRAQFMLGIAYGSAGIWLIGVLFLGIQLRLPSAITLVLLTPVIAVTSLFASSLLSQALVVDPKQNSEIRRAKATLSQNTATRIAVLGSYGKTTMKELLFTVLSEGKKVAATPGNKNVLISHARWVNSGVSGEEDVLIFEYGEGRPGDIALLANFSQPSIAVVTGLAPAHLDAYSSLEAVADDFAAIQNFVKPEHTYIHADSKLLRQKMSGAFYDNAGLEDMKASEVQVDFSGTSFVLETDSGKLKLKTQLLGAHQIGPICAVVAIARGLGMSEAQISEGVAATIPYEHRMQPRHLGGAWIIDDTYNGTIEGMRAGLELLKTLPGKKKIYVTPGLVDQGVETEGVHVQLGKLIAATAPDKVILMQNSATEFIRTGLKEAGFKNELNIETDPLSYYTNLEHFLASGDVVMLQNDLPDSYN